MDTKEFIGSQPRMTTWAYAKGHDSWNAELDSYECSDLIELEGKRPADTRNLLSEAIQVSALDKCPSIVGFPMIHQKHYQVPPDSNQHIVV